MLSHLSLLCLLLSLMLGDALGDSSDKSRTKRALSSYHRYRHHSSKLSVKDLALELAKKHLLKMIVDEQHDLDKAKESVYILNRDSCTKIKSVGKPVTHNTRTEYYGAWMKDPLGIMGAETIFVMEYFTGRNILEEFENMDMFKAGITRKKYKLPYNYDGTGAVVYGPYLYYNRAGTNNIVKFDLHTEREVTQIGLGGSARKNNYQWGGYSGVDMAVDEQGLWVLRGYNGNSYRLIAYKIDVYKNSLIQSWSLNTERMSSMGNAFVACGVVYCIDAYSGRTTTINFAYDTKTGKQWNPNIQFPIQYQHIYMVDYNPREKVLYAWDYKRQVTYPITFEEH